MNKSREHFKLKPQDCICACYKFDNTHSNKRRGKAGSPGRRVRLFLSLSVVLLAERSARCRSYINGGAPEPSRARAPEPSTRRKDIGQMRFDTDDTNVCTLSKQL